MVKRLAEDGGRDCLSKYSTAPKDVSRCRPTKTSVSGTNDQYMKGKGEGWSKQREEQRKLVTNE